VILASFSEVSGVPLSVKAVMVLVTLVSAAATTLLSVIGSGLVRNFRRTRIHSDGGYPYFFVLDKNGKLLQGERTGLLEEGSSYNMDKLSAFLTKWATSGESGK
jgi:hypothetical protein